MNGRFRPIAADHPNFVNVSYAEDSVEKVIGQYPMIVLTAKTNLPDKNFHLPNIELMGGST